MGSLLRNSASEKDCYGHRVCFSPYSLSPRSRLFLFPDGLRNDHPLAPNDCGQRQLLRHAGGRPSRRLDGPGRQRPARSEGGPPHGRRHCFRNPWGGLPGRQNLHRAGRAHADLSPRESHALRARTERALPLPPPRRRLVSARPSPETGRRDLRRLRRRQHSRNSRSLRPRCGRLDQARQLQKCRPRMDGLQRQYPSLALCLPLCPQTPSRQGGSLRVQRIDMDDRCRQLGRRGFAQTDQARPHADQPVCRSPAL